MAIEANKAYSVNIGGSTDFTTSLPASSTFNVSGSIHMVEGNQVSDIDLRWINFVYGPNLNIRFNGTSYGLDLYVDNGLITCYGYNDDGDSYIDPTIATITFTTAPDLGDYEAWFKALMAADEPTPERLITLSNLATFKEEEDALLAGKMSNPMTTQGDLVIGGTNGAPTRLPKGTDGQVLKSSANGLEWGTPASGGVTSLGGATGAITLGSGLTMTNNELSASGGSGSSFVYEHAFYTAAETYSFQAIDDSFGPNCTYVLLGKKNGVSGLYWDYAGGTIYTEVCFIVLFNVPSAGDFKSITQNALYDPQTNTYLNTQATLQNAVGKILQLGKNCIIQSED